VLVEKILIIDHDNGEAGSYKFKPGPNILVSADNSQGKSSLLKTMYYGLGLDIKVFPAGWNQKKMTIKLDLVNEITGKALYIVRKGDLFYVPDFKGSITRADYTKWLSDQLSVDLKLTNKKTQTTSSISHPSALITPFYVDQDESWSGRLFSASGEVNMYSDTPKRIIEYILKISDDEELKLREEISRLRNKKGALVVKRKNINDVYLDYLDDISVEPSRQLSSIINPVESNSKNIELFIQMMDDANKKYIQQKATRIKIQREYDQKLKDNEEYRSIQKMFNSDYKTIKCICKNCKSELTQEQIRTRMEIDTNLFELSFLISTTDQELIEIEKKLANAIEEQSISSIEYEKLAKQVEANQYIKSIAEYIEETSKKKSQDEFASIIIKLEAHIGHIESEINELNKDLGKLVKASTIHAEKVKHSYSDYVNDLSLLMAGSNVSNIDFKSFKIPQSSGVNSNQAYLGAYLAYMRLISEHGRYSLPFCIDSFIKNETATNKSDVMFAATEKYLLNLKGQSIFSAIEESVVNYMKNTTQYNRVDIGERLLANEYFKDALLEIKDIVVVK